VLQHLAKRVFHSLGLELRRARDRSLPFLREIGFEDGRFQFWIANAHTKAWWDRPQLHLNAEFRSLRSLCRPGDVVFDIGAHHGMDTLLLANWVGAAGRVYAFEANADNALVLNANIGANRLGQCEAILAAVGAQAGSIHVTGESVSEAGAFALSVPLVALDEFCAAREIERVHVLKIDVEGFEGEVLRGARKILEQRPSIALELHLDDLARYGTSASGVLGLLDLARYEGTLMVRPDWETLSPFEAHSLPLRGVVNIFLRPLA
jgi:FkbM family methyltransferase